MNASVTMRQAGQSKIMTEARLSFDERKNVYTVFGTSCIYIYLSSRNVRCVIGYFNLDVSRERNCYNYASQSVLIKQDS